MHLKGWVHRSRGSKAIRFVVLRDSTGTLQCVVKRDKVGDGILRGESHRRLIESSLEVKGTVVIPTDREHGYEVQVTEAKGRRAGGPHETHSRSRSQRWRRPMAAKPSSCLDHRHLYLRTGRMTTMLKVRSSIFGAIHSFFRDRDFTEYQAPNFVAGAVEGGSTLFQVPYFGKEGVPNPILAALCRGCNARAGEALHDRALFPGREEPNKEAPDRVLAR